MKKEQQQQPTRQQQQQQQQPKSDMVVAVGGKVKNLDEQGLITFFLVQQDAISHRVQKRKEKSAF